MTAFVLVPGGWTGGWIWREVASRLRESGARAHAVTLTGLGEGSGPAGPETDLDTHIADLVRLLDELGESSDEKVVVVGHGIGIHPVLGAADRRPDRIARIVHLDSGLPGDGDSVLSLLPDQRLAGRLRERAEAGADRLVPPPAEREWPAWGSTEGVPDDALARLARLATPQPLGTLDQPLRLTGAAGRLPATGVLCAANGSSIAMVETGAAMGDPRVRALAARRVTFFELATGHWPMLSAPAELAAVLFRAAAGEGHRPAETPPGPAGPRTFLLDLPPRRRERLDRVDLHLPDAEEPRPAIVFVHGGPVPRAARPTPRDSATFVGYGRFAAALGAVGVTLDHRLHSMADYEAAAEDVTAAVEAGRAHDRVDGGRVALWFFSAGGLLCADWLAAPPPWLRCVALTYPVLAPLPNWGLARSRFRPAAVPPAPGRPPIVLTRVGHEQPPFAATVEEFLTAAPPGAPLDVIDAPHTPHGFETTTHTDEARRAVLAAGRLVLGHLTA